MRSFSPTTAKISAKHGIQLAVNAMILTVAVLTGANSFADEGEAKDTGFESIFNGTDLSGWEGRKDLWSVEDGAITGRTSAENKITTNTFLIYQDAKPGNFELKLKFKIDGGNSGIQYRSHVVDAAEYVIGGYQADIDAELKFAGINYEERGRGILALRGQKVTLKGGDAKEVEAFGDATEIGKVIKSGEWNDYRIVADGNRLQHFINGTLTAEVIDEDAEKFQADGVLALQLHVGPPMTVMFKDLMIKKL